jgi:hypothetical protein
MSVSRSQYYFDGAFIGSTSATPVPHFASLERPDTRISERNGTDGNRAILESLAAVKRDLLSLITRLGAW